MPSPEVVMPDLIRHPSKRTLAQRWIAGQARNDMKFAALTLPLVVFLLFTLLIPIGALLLRAVQNPEVVQSLPRTAQAIGGWDGSGLPAASAYAALAEDLTALRESGDAGALAR